MFEGQKVDFLPAQNYSRGDAVSSSTNLKRKRDIDEDLDLYGDHEPGKKLRGDTKRRAESNFYLMQVDGVSENNEETEWLIFLVGQGGDLQVNFAAKHSFT